VYQLVPLSDAGQSESNEENENTGDRRKNKPEKRRCIQSENASADADIDQTIEVDVDTQLLDEEAKAEQTNLYTQISPQIYLESQKDDQFVEAVINYLQDGTLPTD
jgi:hypothetical protein